jgi:2-polyprenyl-6-methoxyphenol hydroxylase-like FAD-dependent oxidoreductase
VGTHAIVVGAGVGGLAAARALADHFERVTVLERDRLPADASQRPGTPQARHIHGLLAGGLRALDQLFPGFGDDLARAGAVPLRGGLDVRVERPGYDPYPARDLGVPTYAASRPAIDLCLRRRVAQLPNVAWRDGCRALAFVPAPDGSAVTGVRVAADGTEATLQADLVVDASGRGQLTLDLLQATGRPLPEETAIGVDIGYASASFEKPADAPTDWKGVMTFPHAPHTSSGALLLPVEGGLWMVSAGGRGDDKPPGDEAGFLAYLQRLRTPTIHRSVLGARRVGEITRYAFPRSVRRHYERLPALPRGLLPVADAVCTFNPVYGQGMSVAAQEACALQRVLASGRGLQALAPAFFAEAEALLETPWIMAALPDFIYPATTGPRPPDLARTLKFAMALTRLAARKPEVHRLMVEVQHLIKPRSEYRRPWLMAQLMVEMLRG